MEELKLNSHFQIGDKAIFSVDPENRIKCRIDKVHFTKTKVSYDLELVVDYGKGSRMYGTIIKDVDSAFVKDYV